MQSRSFSLRTQLLLAWLAIVGAAATWYSLSLWHSRVLLEQRVAVTTQNLAKTLDQGITNRIGIIDLSLQTIIDELHRQLRAGSKLDGDAINGMLMRHEERLGRNAAIRISDASGRVILGEGVTKASNASWGDRPFFAQLRNDANAGLFISRPILGRVSNIWVVAFMRRYNHADGSFAGIVSTAIPLSELNAMLSNLDLGANGIAVLRDSDLGMITRYPISNAPNLMIGAKIISTELRDLVASGKAAATYYTKNAPDEIARIITYRRLSAAPFHLVVGLAASDYLTEWITEFKESLIELATIILITTAAGFLLWKSIRATQLAAERNEALLRGAGDGIHILDESGNVVEASDSFCRMLGYERDEVIGMNVIRWDAEFSPDQIQRRLANQFSQSQISTFESRHRRKDGSSFEVEITGYPLRLGGRTLLFNSSRDISERKQHEDVLHKATALLQTAKNAAHLGHYVIDTLGDSWSNDAEFDAIFGIPPDFPRHFERLK